MEKSDALSAQTLNRLLVFAAALLFSTGGAAIKSCSLGSWQIAGFRSGIAAIALLILIPEARRGWSLRVWLIGVTYAATLVTFVSANKLTTSANAIFLQSTAPFYLLFFGPVLLHEAIRRVDVAVIAAVAAGALLLLLGGQHAVATAPDPARGNVLAVLSGFFWAITLTGLRWFGKRSGASEGGSASPVAIVTVGNILALAASLPAALPVAHASFTDIAVLLYLGVFQIGLAYLALTRALRFVPGLEASMLLLLEMVLNPLWTWLVHREQPGAFALAGGAVIVSATLAGTWWQARQETAGSAHACR